MSLVYESCLLYMSHVSHIYESCLLYMSHVSYIYESCLLYMSHVPDIWVMSLTVENSRQYSRYGRGVLAEGRAHGGMSVYIHFYIHGGVSISNESCLLCMSHVAYA